MDESVLCQNAWPVVSRLLVPAALSVAAVAALLILAVAALVGVGVGLVGVGFSAAGADAQNNINTNTKAYIYNSYVTSAGDVTVDASSTSSITARIESLSAAIGGGAVGVGVAIA